MNSDTLPDLTAAKHIIDEKIAQHTMDLNAIITAAQAKPAEQRMGFIVEALDEAQRAADADARLCEEIITAATALKQRATNTTATMRDVLNDVVCQRCREIELEYRTTVASLMLTFRLSSLRRRRTQKSTTFSRLLEATFSKPLSEGATTYSP